TSEGWQADRKGLTEKAGLPLRHLSVAATVTIFLQLILGATLRHSAPWDRFLPNELVIAHIAGALAVTIVLGTTALLMVRRYAGDSYLTKPASLAMGLLVVRLFFGLGDYIDRVV